MRQMHDGIFLGKITYCTPTVNFSSSTTNGSRILNYAFRKGVLLNKKFL